MQFAAVLPMTGEQAIYGQPISKGVELAFEMIKEDPDLPFPVELKVADSESDPVKAKELLSDLYSNGALAAVGGVTTAEALQMVAVADSYDRILVSPSASTPELTGISKNFYRVFPSDTREGTRMANFATQKLEIEDVVILAKENPWAKGIQQVFKNEFERYQGKVTELIEFPADSSDVSGLIERVLTLNPSAVYLAAYAQDVARMIVALRAKGYKGTIFTTSAFASPEIIEQVGAPAEGVYLTQAAFDLDSDDPATHRFVTAYREKYALSPDLYAAHGYDAMFVLAEALKKGGGRTSSDMWKGIRSIRNLPGATGMIQFDERGDAQKFPRVYVIKNGGLVDYEAEVENKRQELLKRLRELEQRQRVGGDEAGEANGT